jgi:hypothetical protein
MALARRATASGDVAEAGWLWFKSATVVDFCALDVLGFALGENWFGFMP